MARIAGINIPSGKKVKIALTYIYGIGQHSSLDICSKSGVSSDKRVTELTEEEVIKLREIISSSYTVEGDLRRAVSENITKSIRTKSYKGRRHMAKLPVNGQNTRSNGRTRKGKAVPIAGKKKVTK